MYHYEIFKNKSTANQYYSIDLFKYYFAQVRPDIYSFDSTQRTELGNLILDFVNTDIIKMHCDYTTIMGVNVNIEYKLGESINSAYLILQRPYMSTQNQYILDVNNSSLPLNVSNLYPGTYSVILVCDGIPRHSKTLTVQ